MYYTVLILLTVYFRHIIIIITLGSMPIGVSLTLL